MSKIACLIPNCHEIAAKNAVFCRRHLSCINTAHKLAERMGGKFVLTSCHRPGIGSKPLAMAAQLKG